ncbi:MAG: methionyl-tRNA formyltransferase [Clostridiaceae bacterium]|jgi:methionyl-tRNA formyltransferase|nr:methionyl-tRNA formyltransferase [Clostridiaceae bacterium]
MRIIFMGTPDFSAVVLERLLKDYAVAAAVTGPDKPVGRGYGMRFSPVKEFCLERGITVLQYAKVSREGLEDIRALFPDLIITAAFGQILSDEFLKIPPLGVLNVHASLLPKYRGAAPIQWAIINGETLTGITIMRTVREVDAGDILLQRAVNIGENETSAALFGRLAVVGGEALVDALKLIESGKAVFTPQNHAEATQVRMLKKEDGLLDFSKTAQEIKNLVRGVAAYTKLGGKQLSVFEVEEVLTSEGIAAKPGEVLASDPKNGLIVAVKGGAVRLKILKIEGKNRMSDGEFLRGYKIPVNTVLG